MSSMAGGFTLTERFDPSHEGWAKYVAWSRLTQLREVVGLDQLLTPSRMELDDDVWPHLVEAALPQVLVRDRAWLVARYAPATSEQILYVVHDPAEEGSGPREAGFERLGFELLEHDGSISALTNCGGFPLAFDNAELNPYGLLGNLVRAREVQAALAQHYPGEPHAVVDVYEIWRERA